MIRDGENEARTSNILGLLLDHGAEVTDNYMYNVQHPVFIRRWTVLTSKGKAGLLFTVRPTGIHTISNIVIVIFVIVKVTLIYVLATRIVFLSFNILL